MSQSLSKLYVHLIFHVKNNIGLIRQEDEKELYASMGGVIKLSKSIPIKINGIEDHIHVLCTMSKNISLADLMEDLKKTAADGLRPKACTIKILRGKLDMPGFLSVNRKLMW